MFKNAPLTNNTMLYEGFQFTGSAEGGEAGEPLADGLTNYDERTPIISYYHLVKVARIKEGLLPEQEPVKTRRKEHNLFRQ